MVNKYSNNLEVKKTLFKIEKNNLFLTDKSIIFKNNKTKIYSKNEFIFKEEDYVNFVYYIKKGKVKRIKSDSHGKEFLNDIHYKNEFFGYLNLFNNTSGQHQRTAIALQTTELILIPKIDFQRLINQNKDVAANFIKILSNNVLDKEERLLQLAYASVRARVAMLLLKLNREEKFKNDSRIIRISRTNLANIIGTSKETLIRTLTEFKNDKIIKTGRAEIEIIDKKALERIISFC